MSSVSNEYAVYIGGRDPAGIYRARFDVESGDLTQPEAVVEIDNPGWLALNPHRPVLYATCLGDSCADAGFGEVNAFEIDIHSGDLSFIGSLTGGGRPFVHLDVDPAGTLLAAASYHGAAMAVFPLLEDGRIAEAVVEHEFRHPGSGVVASRQGRAFPHSFTFDRTGEYAYLCDLGADTVWVYRRGADGVGLEPHDPASFSLAPGAGPRHVAWHPDGDILYVINELANTITVWRITAGTARELRTVGTLPPDFRGESATAEVAVSPDGRFVYGSNRGHNSIAVLAVEHGTGLLDPVGWTPTGGDHPRHFALDDTGRWCLVANRTSGTVVVFRRDAETGMLTQVGRVGGMVNPQCVVPYRLG